MKAPYLIGQLVYLRAIDSADAGELQAFINHPEVRRHIQAWRPASLENETEFIGRTGRSETDVVLGIARRNEDGLIGVCGLHQIDWQNRCAKFGIAIGVIEEWGKGYGTEATRLITGYGFDRLNLHRIELDVYSPNARGIRAYEKVGYRREGVLREGVFRDGAWLDVHRMAILESEWRAQAR